MAEKIKKNKLSRPPLARMLKIHEALAAGKYPNCSRLAVELEVVTKTVQRDLEFMRDQLNLPLEYDARRFGYHYTEPVAAFPNMQVSEGELLALFVAQKALTQYRGTVFEKPLASAFRKLTESLPEEISVGAGGWDSVFSFKTVGAPVSDLALFTRLSAAVQKSLAVSFGYRKLRGDSHEQRRVRPCHLTCADNQWYLLGFDEARAGIRTFVLSRMNNLTVSDRHFTRPRDFSPREFLAGSFGIFSGGKKQTVRVRFDAFAARLVSERNWHASQKIKWLKNGDLELTLTLSSLPEVERWILSWGDHAEALAPKELRARLKVISKNNLDKYRRD
ncbi:MAG: WYL domain-containing protein [Verrucomicrobiales bacterium]|jgi:proteasome accessory factor B|nr:WYL domain-containing protein [Verrucomicrobiales bacterium]